MERLISNIESIEERSNGSIDVDFSSIQSKVSFNLRYKGNKIKREEKQKRKKEKENKTKETKKGGGGREGEKRDLVRIDRNSREFLIKIQTGWRSSRRQ